MNYKRPRRRNNYKCHQAKDDNMPTDRQNYKIRLHKRTTTKCQHRQNDNMTETTIREITTKYPYRPKNDKCQHRQNNYNAPT